MTAPTQTTSDKAVLSQVVIESATDEGVYLFSLGSIKVGFGTGSPQGEVTAPIGSWFIDVSTGKKYINFDASTGWDIECGYYHFYVPAASAVAADTDGVLAAVTDTGASQTITTNLTSPTVPRNITATAGGTAGDIKAISVTVVGTNYSDAAITEAIGPFTVNTAGSVTGSKAFKTVTSVTIPAHDGTGATTSIGWGDKLGLHKVGAHIACVDTFLDDTLEGTAATIAASATAIDGCTIDLNSALDGTDVDAYLIYPG